MKHKYTARIQAQIDNAGGYEAYRERMRQVRKGVSKITPDIIQEIGALYARGMTQDQISVKLGIPQTTVSLLLRRAGNEASNPR